MPGRSPRSAASCSTASSISTCTSLPTLCCFFCKRTWQRPHLYPLRKLLCAIVYAFAQTRLSRKTSIVPRFWHAGTSLSYGLQEQVRQRKLRVPRATSVGQVMGDEITEAQSFVQPTNQNQAAV